MYESIKALKVKTSMVVNFIFADNIILSCFFFLIIDLCVLISAVIAQIYNSTAELVIPIRIPAKKAEVEIETHPVTGVAKISKCSFCFISAMK